MKFNSSKNMEDVFLQYELIPSAHGGTIGDPTDEGRVLVLLKRLEKTCKSVAESVGDVFYCKDGKRVTYSKAGTDFLNIIKNQELERIDEIFPESRLHPYIQVVTGELKSREIGWYVRSAALYEMTEKGKVFVDKLNDLVNGIRNRVNTPEFKATIKNYNKLLTENRKSTGVLVHKLFGEYSKVLVVRVDLSYKKDRSRPLDQQNISHSDVRDHMATLRKWLRGKNFKNSFITYIWKLEYGPIKGYHYHGFFFFNGEKVKNDKGLAKLIGEHWSNEVTKGSGGYYNCNAAKAGYPVCGIGMIERNDKAKIDALKNKALEYVMKVDYYVRPIADSNIRTYQTGQMPKKPAKRRGRPRKDLAEQAEAEDVISD